MACSKLQNLSQATLLGMTASTPIGDFLNKIPLTQWEVVSFNPSKREACIKVYKNFNATEIQAQVDALRLQMAAATDKNTKLSLQGVILERLNQLNNPPYNLVAVPISRP